MNVNSLGFSGSFLAKNESWIGRGWMMNRVVGLSEGSGSSCCFAKCCKLLICLFFVYHVDGRMALGA